MNRLLRLLILTLALDLAGAAAKPNVLFIAAGFFLPHVPCYATQSAHRILTYDPATDEALWEGTVVRRSDPIPQ